MVRPRLPPLHDALELPLQSGRLRLQRPLGPFEKIIQTTKKLR